MLYSPFNINTLLHVYAVAEPFTAVPALSSSLEYLKTRGLIEIDTAAACGYKTTAKGRYHVKALCSLPFPEPNWTIPNCNFEVKA